MDKEQSSTDEATNQKSEDVEALLETALSLDKAGRYEEMLEAAQRAIDLDPASALAWACKVMTRPCCSIPISHSPGSIEAGCKSYKSAFRRGFAAPRGR